jgi:hypothetical protein
MGYYYRCRIPPLGDEDAWIAFDAVQIGLSSALAEMLQIRGRTGRRNRLLGDRWP